jgi:hypothetical protein
MGSSPHAVLAYGYDLTEDADLYDKPTPAWLDDEGVSWRDNAARALLAAMGRIVAPGEYFDPEDVTETCGVALIKLGYDSDSGVILASNHFTTDWDDNLSLPTPLLAVPGDRLDWALDVLGIERNVEPTWLLAAWHG